MKEDRNLSDLLVALVSEAPDVLCGYADMSRMTLSDAVGVSASGSSQGMDAVARWIGASRAFALGAVLGRRLPLLRRPRLSSRVRWAHEGAGEVEPSMAGMAMAQGCPDGLPWVAHRRDSVSPEVQMLASALRTADRSLEWLSAGASGLAGTLSRRASEVRRTFRLLGAELAAGYPALDPSQDPRPWAIAVRAKLARDGDGADPAVGRIAALFAASWKRGVTAREGGLPLLTLGGDEFANKLLELLLLARLRSWIMPPGSTGGTWHGKRLLGAGGMPIFEGTIGEEPARMWFQSSKALPPYAVERGGDGVSFSWSIPDVAVCVGTGTRERRLIVDAKNYGSGEGISQEALRLVGDADLRGIRDKRVMVVRPGPAEKVATARDPGRGGYAISLVEMPLGAAGRDLPGRIASEMLARAAG